MSDKRTVPVSELVDQVKGQQQRQQQALMQPTLAELCVALNNALSTVVSAKHIHEKQAGGSKIKFVPHYHVKNYLDFIVKLWEWEITKLVIGPKRIYLVGKLTIYGCDGKLSRDATACEDLECSSYGDPSSNAEAMALRRAAMAFGFCRTMWGKK